MSSSQGANVGTIPRGYTFTQAVLRDGSDWTTLLKQKTVFGGFKSTLGVRDTASVYDKFGNDFRLTFLNGRFKCTTCYGNAFQENGVRLV